MAQKQFLKADARHPNMGINNKPCKDPKYWCRIHEFWLSEDDVQKKGCRAKMSADMMERRLCTSLEERDYKEFKKNLLKK